MCTQGLVIKSNSKRFKSYVSRSHLIVPCGKCPQCLSQAQDEWFLRTWSEIKKYNDAGGKVVFVTLTYNSKNLPVYTDVYESVDPDTGELRMEPFSVPCFSKRHKDKFLNSLNKFFERQGYTGETCSFPLRFIWCSEYGEDQFATHRPHYHVLLFFPPEYFSCFRNKQHLKDTIQKYWSYGFCRWSKEVDGGIYVKSEFAAKYVTKYVVKQIDYFNQPDVNAYLYDSDGKVIPDRYEKIKAFLPHHWQSKSFGLGLIDFCNDDRVFKDGLNFKFVGDISLGKRKIYKVPRYIERKLLYKIDEFGSLVLNDRGKEVKKKYFGFDEKLQLLEQHNHDLLQSARFGRYKETFDYYLHGKSVRYFSAWQLSMIGALVSSEDVYTLDVSVFNSEEKFVALCRTVYNARIDGYSPDDFYTDIGFMDDKDCPKHENIESFSDFSLFNQLNLLLLQLRHEQSVLAFEDYMKDRQIRKHLKKLIV